jgi:hypothetical protein
LFGLKMKGGSGEEELVVTDEARGASLPWTMEENMVVLCFGVLREGWFFCSPQRRRLFSRLLFLSLPKSEWEVQCHIIIIFLHFKNILKKLIFILFFFVLN